MGSLKRWTQVGQGQFHKWVEPGEKLEGLWQGTKDGQFGPLGMLELPDGSRLSFPLHTALLQRVEAIEEGAEIRIVYLGKQISKNGREFKAFEVFVASVEDLKDEPDSDVPF